MAQYDVYIAGAMTGRTVESVICERAWAKVYLKYAGLTYYDPAEDEGLQKCSFDAVISTAFNKRRMRRFVSKDLAAVAESRCILNLTGDMHSDGTAWEMSYAVWYRQIPVHLVAPLRNTGEKMGFTNILVDGVHKDLASAIRAIKKSLKE